MDPIVWAKAEKNSDDGTILNVEGERVYVSMEDQVGFMDVGTEYLLLVNKDSEGSGWIGTEKIDKYTLEVTNEGEYVVNQKLTGYVYRETPLGLKIYFDNKHSGIVYRNEIFRNYELGQQVDVYIKNIRTDLKIDLAFTPKGYKAAINDTREIIMNKLKESNGVLNFSDKSTPEEIYKKFGISKKKFKEAIGALYKQKKIAISDDFIKSI